MSIPDLILAADCVYYEPAFPLLVQTLSELAIDDKTEVLFCYKKRRKVTSFSSYPYFLAPHLTFTTDPGSLACNAG